MECGPGARKKQEKRGKVGMPQEKTEGYTLKKEARSGERTGV